MRALLLPLFLLAGAALAQLDGVPEDVFMFVRPPLAAAEAPQMLTNTDSSIALNFSYDTTTDLTRAVEVTNVTEWASLTDLMGGNFSEVDPDSDEGLNTTMTDHLHLHSIFETYLMRGQSLSLPLYDVIPDGKSRVFLRKPVKRFEVQMMLRAKPNMGPDFDAEVGKWELMTTLDTTAREAEVEALHPGCLYAVRVCSGNSAGVGACSEETEMKTADVPSKPGKVRKGRSTPTSLQVVVLKPVATNGAELTDITLETSRKQHGPWRRLDYDMAVAKKTVADLEPGSLYFFRSRAWNKIGPSEWSDVAQFETDSMVPKRIPKIELIGQSADKLLATTDVELGWNTSDPRGRPIRDYQVQKAFGYDTSDGNFYLECLTEALNCTAKGLKAGKMYHFRVCANNAIGASAWSDMLEIIAAPAVTLAPGPVELKEGGTRSLSLSFDRPSDYRGSPPKYYLVQLQEIPKPMPPINISATGPVDFAALKAMKPKPVFWNDVYKGLETTIEVVDFIRPAQGYRFRVHAVNAVGASEWSEETVITTEVAPPDAPSDLTAYKVTTTGMTVRWSRPAGNGAEVRKYRLKMGKLADVRAYLNYSNGNASKLISPAEAATAAPGGQSARSDAALGVNVLLSSRAAAQVARPRAIALIEGEGDDEDEEVDTNFKDQPGAGTDWMVGSGTRTKQPCKAIHPNVYDRPVDPKYLLPDVIPGSQPVYPVIPGKEAMLPPNKTGWGFGEAPNITLPPGAGAGPAARGGEVGVDGFELVYEGELNETEVGGLTAGTFYAFSVQAVSDLGVSPESVYTTIQAKPTVPQRPGPPARDRQGRNYLAVSWQPSRARGFAVTGYVVQISHQKDAYGYPIWQNTCLREWDPALAGWVARNFSAFPDTRAEMGLTAKDVQLDDNGGQMDFCRRGGGSPPAPAANASAPPADMRYRPLECCVDSLAAETAYSFRVAAISGAGLSEWGPAAEMVTRGSPPLMPATPAVAGATSASISLAWSQPPAAASRAATMTFNVEVAMSEAGNPQPRWSGNATACVVDGLAPAHVHLLRVQAENHNGKSPWSEFVHGTTCAEGTAACSGVVPAGAEVDRDDDPAGQQRMVMLTQLAFDAKLRQRVASNPSLMDKYDSDDTHPQRARRLATRRHEK